MTEPSTQPAPAEATPHRRQLVIVDEARLCIRCGRWIVQGNEAARVVGGIAHLPCAEDGDFAMREGA